MTKEFTKTTLKMLIPLVLQSLFSAMMGSVDVIMLNAAGQTAIAAGSLASQWGNILFMVLFGACSGGVLLSSQYFGKKDFEAIKAIEGITLKVTLIWSSVLALGAVLIPNLMMRVYTNDPVLIEEGAKYLRVISLFYVFQAISTTYFYLLRSVNQVKISTILNAVAFVLNIILNAAFLFGWCGLPKLGITGVALASTISSGIITIFGCAWISITNKDLKLDFRYMFIKSKTLTKDFFKMSVPALLNDVSWGLAFSVYVAIMGRLGSDVVAANSLVTVVRQFATVLCFSVASVAGIIVGNLIGAKKMEEAEQAARDYMIITVITGAIGGLLVLAAMPFVLDYASLTPTALKYLKGMLWINTYYCMGQAVNTTLIAGIFRAGGDTKFGLICDTIDMWGYGVPAGLITAFVLKLPVMWVYFFLCLDEFVKWPWVLKHYFSKSWLKNITKENVIDQ